MAAMAKVEASLQPMPVAVAYVPPPETFVVFFPYNRATLDRQARQEVAYIVNRARTLNANSIKLAGYTDRAGKDDYNMRLSAKREAAVHKAIDGAGLNAAISGAAFGETQLATATDDGVREASNRRVVVVVTPSTSPAAPQRARLDGTTGAPLASAAPASLPLEASPTSTSVAPLARIEPAAGAPQPSGMLPSPQASLAPMPAVPQAAVTSTAVAPQASASPTAIGAGGTVR
jgi:hypothetical protein